MSRIRSIHPGIWTDEAFVSLSGFARLMFIGLWNECDDKGTFQWSPLQMKMRILPADNVNAAELLAEIEAAGCIMQYEIGGKKYGAVRNFCKFQRPKKPNNVHPISEQAGVFAGYNGEAVPHQFPTDGEKSPQMEDGGEKESKKAYAFSARVVRLTRADYDRWRKEFSAIPDFDAELMALDAWLTDQPETKQRKWFGTGASWLSRRHQEHTANRQRAGPALVVPI